MKLDGEKVRRAREQNGLPMRHAAKIAGVSEGTIIHAERDGEVRPTTARKLADAYGVEVADLFPKAEAPSEGRFSEAEVALAEAYLEQRRNAHRTLKAWRTYAEREARDWEARSRDGRELPLEVIRSVLGSLEGPMASDTFEIRRTRHTARVDAIVDTRSQDAADDFELERLREAVTRLRAAADRVLQSEQADRERAAERDETSRRFEVIEGGLADELYKKTA